ncbi:MAG: hypothetical protein B6229_08715, partial [Spirochaetaceae bacterium 4572_7]
MVSLLENRILSLLNKSSEYNKVSTGFLERSFPIEITGVRGGFSSFLISSLNRYTKENSLVIVPTEQDAISLYNDLKLVTDKVQIMPWWGTMLYKGISPGAQVFGRRVECLNKVLNEKKVTTILSLRSFLTNLPDPNYLKPLKETLTVGSDIDLYNIGQVLSTFGYNKVPRVTIHGEFALRGEVLDFYPPGADEAIRVVFEFDEIEEIKYFNPTTQISTDKLKEITITPTKEILWSDERINTLEERLKKIVKGDSSAVIEGLRTYREFRGEELFYPLSFSENFTILDYMESNSPIFYINPESLEARSEVLDKEYLELYTKALASKIVVPSHREVMSTFKELYEKSESKILLPGLKQQYDYTSQVNIDFVCESGRSFFGNVNYLKEELAMYKSNGYRVFIFAESNSQGERISHMLKDFDVKVITEGLIGGKSWAKKKSRVRKSVEDLADMLIKLYATREKAVGFSFPKDDDFQLG